MTKRDGLPCRKCGTSSWRIGGNCKRCVWLAAQTSKAKSVKRAYRQSASGKKSIRDSNKAYQKTDGGKFAKRSARSKRRTAKTEAGGSFTAGEWQDLQNHHGNVCLKCGRDDVPLTADHVISVSHGGSSHIDNIQPLCRGCNSSKHTQNTDYRGGNFITRWLQGKLV